MGPDLLEENSPGLSIFCGRPNIQDASSITGYVIQSSESCSTNSFTCIQIGFCYSSWHLVLHSDNLPSPTQPIQFNCRHNASPYSSFSSLFFCLLPCISLFYGTENSFSIFLLKSRRFFSSLLGCIHIREAYVVSYYIYI